MRTRKREIWRTLKKKKEIVNDKYNVQGKVCLDIEKSMVFNLSVQDVYDSN